MNIQERFLAGEAVPFSDPEYPTLMKICEQTRETLMKINNEPDLEKSRILFNSIFQKPLPESATIMPPFHTNFGKNISIGENVFINHDCSFLDLGGITIEDDVLIAPKVVISTEGHPSDVANRKKTFAQKVHIKKNAWIGANVSILPGVSIGENSIVAAGAVVTQDIPDNVVVGGIPAKIIKHL